MNRREFIAGLGGAAAWPVVAHAQQRAMPVIGFLNTRGPLLEESLFLFFRKGLQDMGYVEGSNVAFEHRGTQQSYQLAALAAELARRQVALIVALGTANSALAAKAATATIPIVFSNGSDPVKLGLVASLNQPGGNITGVNNYQGALGPKRFEQLRELVPGATIIGLLRNPTNLISEGDTDDLQNAARSVNKRLIVFNATNVEEIDAAFAAAAEQRVGALIINVDGTLFYRRKEQIVALAAHYGIPASYSVRDFPALGGLMSYGAPLSDIYRLVGNYAGRILKGEKPADLPVLQPTKFELIINLKTAKALGLTIPETLLATADEVIQ
jgi:putative tryptophan/tyrosine transport system substrate-binding protein